MLLACISLETVYLNLCHLFYVANIPVLNFVAWFVYISNSYWLHEHIFVHFDC